MPWYGLGSISCWKTKEKKRRFFGLPRKNTAGLIFGSWISSSSEILEFFSDKLRPAPCLFFLKGEGGGELILVNGDFGTSQRFDSDIHFFCAVSKPISD